MNIIAADVLNMLLRRGVVAFRFLHNGINHYTQSAQYQYRGHGDPHGTVHAVIAKMIGGTFAAAHCNKAQYDQRTADRHPF